jgi:hypothetical protein
LIVFEMVRTFLSASAAAISLGFPLVPLRLHPLFAALLPMSTASVVWGGVDGGGGGRAGKVSGDEVDSRAASATSDTARGISMLLILLLLLLLLWR